MPFPDGARLAAYFRDSGGVNQDKSVAQQEAAVGEWCRERGYILARVFKDIARSGMSADRAEFQAMIQYFSNEAQEAGLLVWEFSRIARDLDDFQYYVSMLRRAGYVVHSITDNIPQGIDGQLLENIIAWKNAKYSLDLRKNIRRGQQYVSTVYHAYRGQCPMGYKLQPVNIGKRRDGSDHVIQQLIIDPDTAPLVIKAYEMRSVGATFREIHQELHLFPYLSSYTVMLRNDLYLGRRKIGDVMIDDFCPPIIEQDLFEAVQRVNERRANQTGAEHPRRVRSRFILSGLLYCAKCGRAMYGRNVGNGYKHYDYYTCNSRAISVGRCGAKDIPKLSLEQLVLAAVETRLLQPDVLAEMYAEYLRQSQEGDTEQEAQRARLNAERADVTREIAHIISAIKDAGHSAALLTSLTSLERRQAEISETLARLDHSPPVIELDIAEIASSIGAALEAANEVEKAEILRGFIERVTVEKINGTLMGEIEYSLPIEGAGMTQIMPL